MFLALTALSEWWDKEADILLLGSWCAPYARRGELSSLRYQMMPSPWDDRERFHQAAAYANDVYERLLRHLAAHLNAAHGVQHPVRYWRLLVGPWLMHFVHATYDRYIHVSDALSRVPELRTAVLAKECFRTPRSTADAMVWLTQDDHYNWQLFTELLDGIGRGIAGQTCVAFESNVRSAAGSVRRLTQPISLLVTRALNAVAVSRPVLLTDISAPRSAVWALMARSGFQMMPFRVTDELRELTVDPVWSRHRLGLADLPAADAFERVCIRMLVQHLPTLYLEGYEQARRVARQFSPHAARVLITENGWYMNETYRYVAAEALVRGTRLVIVQHGGGCYGQARSAPLELLERSIGDAYFVWGWANGQRSLRNIAHPLVSRSPRRSFDRQRTRIVFAPQSMQRYLHRLQSHPVGAQWEAHWGAHRRFVGALSNGVRRRLVLRPPPVDYDSGIQQRLQDAFPDIRLDDAATFKRSMTRSRFAVIDTLGTAMLETLAMNLPTVLFWDPAVWEVRGEVAPYLEAMRKAGILWDSPESAATHLMQVYEQPAQWWESHAVQEARCAFVERFACARKGWIESWLRAVREELMVPAEAAAAECSPQRTD